MNKTNKILSVLLVVQLLITGYLYGSGRNDANPQVEILPGLTGDQVERMVISETPEKQAVLLKGKDGWQVELASGRDYPADAKKVEAMLARLAGLKSARLVSRTAAGEARLKVADDQYNRKVELKTGAGEKVLYLGTSPSYQSIHVRAGDDNGVYLVRDLALWELPAQASGWWQANYLDADPEKLLEVEIQNHQGTLHLSRGAADAPWSLGEGQPAVDGEKVKVLLGEVSRVAVNDVIADTAWRPSGFPEATVTLKAGDGEKQLEIWPRPDEKSDYPVKLRDSSFYAKAGGYAVDPILKAKVADLRQQEPKAENQPEKGRTAGDEKQG